MTIDATDSVVFLGDSITDAQRRSTTGGLGEGYVRVLAGRLTHDVVNVGVSGDRTREILARWQTDVAPHLPALLSIYVGVNDSWRRYDSDDPESDERFESEYREIIARAGGSPLVLVEPFAVAPLAMLREDLDAKAAIVASLAAEHGAVLVPLQGLFDAHDPAEVTTDGVHPTPAGHALIADAWLAAVADAAAPDTAAPDTTAPDA